MKKRLFALLAAVMTVLCCLTACGGSSSKVIEYADMKALAEKMVAADSSFPDMLIATDADENAQANFASVSQMDYTRVAHYLIAYSSEGKADEIVVIAMKDKNEVLAAKTALDTHMMTRKNMYRTYDPSQEPRVAAAEIFMKGYYAVMIVSDHADAVAAAFDGGSAAD